MEKLRDLVAGGVEQIDGADERGQTRLADLGGQAEQAGHVIEIGDGRHAVGKLGIGGDVADAAAQVGGVGTHGLAEDLGPAGRGPVQTDDQTQQRGLAGPVGAEQTEDAARLEPQRHVIQGNLAVLVNLGELVGLDHQVAACRPRGSLLARDNQRGIIRGGERGSYTNGRLRPGPFAD